MKRSTKDPDAFLDKLIMNNISLMIMEKNFKSCDTVSMSILTDIIKGFITKMASDAKSIAELNCRTDSNMIDLLNCLNLNAHISKTDIINHIQKSPFKLVCWEKNIVKKITNEQQAKADMYIKNHIQKIEFKEQEENAVLTVPDEVINIKGFTSIPPFLRVFPSILALQNVIKDSNKQKETIDITQEISQKEAENQMLKIKNKRDVEDKIVSITLKENLQKTADDFNMSELNRKDSLISNTELQHKNSRDDSNRKTLKGIDKNNEMEDLFGEENDTINPIKPIEERNRDEIPAEILQREADEPSDIKTKKRAAKGARKIKELSNLFV